MKILIILLALLLRRLWDVPDIVRLNRSSVTGSALDYRSINRESWLSPVWGCGRHGLQRFLAYSIFGKTSPLHNYCLLQLLGLLAISVLGTYVNGFVAVLIWLMLQICLLAVAYGGLLFEDEFEQYLPYWRAQDRVGVVNWIAGHYGQALIETEQLNSKTIEELHFIYWLLWIDRWLVRVFAILFWFLIVGPAALVFIILHHVVARISAEDPGVAPGEQAASAAAGKKAEDWATLAQVLTSFEGYLTWLPGRLLVISFLLAGNFSKALKEARKGFAQWKTPEPQLIYLSSREALGVQPWLTDQDGRIKQGERQFRALKRLLTRCLYIWLGAIAVFTIFFG